MKHCRLSLTLLLLALSGTGTAFGAGFALIEQGVKGLGNAYAGAAAVAEDPSTVYFNPAGMTRLQGQQAQAAVHVILPSAKFDKESATNALGTPLSGRDGGDGGVTGVAPNFYYTLNTDEGWAFGLGINAPFGLSTDYDRTWVGRYHAVESEVITININPSVAYKVNKNLSVGAGVSVQYIDATLSSMVDYGLFAINAATDPTDPLFGTLNPIIGSIVPNISNTQADIFSEVTADDWSYGYNLGALYEFTENTRIGVAYRSKIQHDLEGDVEFEIPTTFLASQSAVLAGVAGNVFKNQDASGGIDLPASAALSAYHRINPQWALLADVMWTEWSSFDKLDIQFEGTLASRPSVTTENWEDNWRYSVGATFNPTEALTLRSGIAYDETAISSATDRTPRVPDAARFWVALGAGYQVNSFSFDVAYAHLFVDDAKVHKTTADPENVGRGNLVGSYENSVDIASIEVTYRF